MGVGWGGGGWRVMVFAVTGANIMWRRKQPDTLLSADCSDRHRVDRVIRDQNRLVFR